MAVPGKARDDEMDGAPRRNEISTSGTAPGVSIDDFCGVQLLSAATSGTGQTGWTGCSLRLGKRLSQRAGQTAPESCAGSAGAVSPPSFSQLDRCNASGRTVLRGVGRVGVFRQKQSDYPSALWKLVFSGGNPLDVEIPGASALSGLFLFCYCYSHQDLPRSVLPVHRFVSYPGLNGTAPDRRQPLHILPHHRIPGSYRSRSRPFPGRLGFRVRPLSGTVSLQSRGPFHRDRGVFAASRGELPLAERSFVPAGGGYARPLRRKSSYAGRANQAGSQRMHRSGQLRGAGSSSPVAGIAGRRRRDYCGSGRTGNYRAGGILT